MVVDLDEEEWCRCSGWMERIERMERSGVDVLDEWNGWRGWMKELKFWMERSRKRLARRRLN